MGLEPMTLITQIISNNKMLKTLYSPIFRSSLLERNEENLISNFDITLPHVSLSALYSGSYEALEGNQQQQL